MAFANYINIAQISQGKKNKNPKKNNHNGMGFVQVAKIEKLSADEIRESINDEPNNNIVEITEVNDTLPEDQSSNESVMEIESLNNTTCKRTLELTQYEKMFG